MSARPAAAAGRAAGLPAVTRVAVRARLARLDLPLLGAVSALSVIGALLVWSASRPALLAAGEDPQSLLKRHVLNIVVGFVLAAIVARVDVHQLPAYAPACYGVAVAALVVVLSPVGTTINGSHSWIVLGAGLQIQPSEPAKVALVLLLATVLAVRGDAETAPAGRRVAAALAVGGGPICLIMLQPDLGTTLVFAAVILGMVAISGARKRWLAGLAAVAVAGTLAVWRFGLLAPYQIARFTAFVDPYADPGGAGYNTGQSLIAVGSGGLFGSGLGRGGQTGGRFVPEQHTDFIFTVAGEELGFIGCCAILALLSVIFWRGLRLAARSPDTFGCLLAAGIVCWFGFQAFVNIGMTIGIMPITGLPLPFVSYGGSATFANLVAVGLLLALHRRVAATRRRPRGPAARADRR